jgi:hypothetical protein
MSPYTNFHYLERRLNVHFLTDEHSNEQELRHIFVYQYLQGDGTFMLRLLASNVSDYVCRKIIIELYRKFRIALLTEKIGRESLFKSIQTSKYDDDDNNLNDDDDDDESTDQTMAADIPPIPNPRHGKIFVEHDTLRHISSETTFIKPSEPQRTVFFTLPSSIHKDEIRLRTSPIPLLKDIRRTTNTQIDSSNQSTPQHKSVEFQHDSQITPLSTSPSISTPSSSPLSTSTTIKGPSPYATTYLTTKKRNEHELPYIDDSNSSSSTTDRSANATVGRQLQTSTTILTSTNALFQRSHDV